MSKIKLRRATLADVDEATVCISAAYAPALREIPDLPDVTGGVAHDIATYEAVVAEDRSIAQQGHRLVSRFTV